MDRQTFRGQTNLSWTDETPDSPFFVHLPKAQIDMACSMNFLACHCPSKNRLHQQVPSADSTALL
jgi:hypothetical protein